MTCPSGGSYSASDSCGVSWASAYLKDERSKRVVVVRSVDRVILLVLLLLLFAMFDDVDGAEECLLEVEGDDEKSVDDG